MTKKLNHQATPVIVLVGALTLALSACISVQHIQPVMKNAATDDRTPPAGQALVVFVYPPNPEQTNGLGVYVTEPDGRLVAELHEHQRVAIPVAPGKHVYYGATLGQSVEALIAEVEPGKLYVVSTGLSRGEGRPLTDEEKKTNDKLVRQVNGLNGQNAAAQVAGYTSISGALAQMPKIVVHMDPLGKRTGKSRADIDSLLNSTVPLAVDPENGRKFQEGFGSSGPWERTMRLAKERLDEIQSADADAHTLRAADGF